MPAEPTFATQRSPDRYSDGPAVGAAIHRWLGRRPSHWQAGFLDVALERVDGPGSPFAYDEIIGIVGRRCGKTVTAMGVPLARALAGPVTLPNGRRLPFRAVHIAQNLTSARQRFQEDLVEPYARRFPGETFATAAEFSRAAADTKLVLDPRRVKDLTDARARGIASELRVLAPTGSSARGAGVAHRTYDEALTYTRERGDELTAAGRPTMAEMMGHAQTWTVSNIALETGERDYLWHQRNKGRAAAKADRRDGICYLEFSLPPGEDPDDERAWWEHYPALGDGIVGIRELRRDREEMGAAFHAEYLCRWSDENDLGSGTWTALDRDAWQTAAVETVIPDDVDVALGVDVDPFGRSASIVAAAIVEGRLIVEVIDHRPETEWITAALLELAADAIAIGIDDYGAGRALLADLETMPVFAGRVVKTSSPDLVAACFRFDAGIREHRISWRRTGFHDALTAAASAAERTSGRAWQWERRVSVSQTPLVAATLAAHALTNRPVVPDSAIY